MRGLLYATLGALVVAAAVIYSTMMQDQKPQIVQAPAVGAMAELRAQAEAGDVRAQYAFGVALDRGSQVPEDNAAAAVWYRKAAEKGYAKAQYALGRLYELGEGVSPDLQKAAEYYRIAGGLGRDADAQFALAQLFFSGRGVPHDFGQALDWYRKAANGGHPAAQYLVGAMYEEGWGVRPDVVEAYKWFLLASQKRDVVLQVDQRFDPDKALARLAEGMAQHQIAQAKEQVAAWQPRH